MLRLVATAAVLLGAQAAKEHCECLNWKQLYDSERVLCGEGRELGNLSWPFQALVWGKESMNKEHSYDFICEGVYKKMDNNYCTNYNMYRYGWTAEDLDPKTVNYDINSDRPGWRGLEQWCYVDSKCKDKLVVQAMADRDSVATWPKWLGSYMTPKLYSFIQDYIHFPRKIRRDVAVKVCKKGKDKRTRDMPPMELLAMGKKNDLRLGTLTKMAYPVARDQCHVIECKHEPLWSDVRDAVAKGDATLIADKFDFVRQAIKDKACIVLDTDAHRHSDSQRIICGKELIKINSECKEKHLNGADNHCILKLDGKLWQFEKGSDIAW